MIYSEIVDRFRKKVNEYNDEIHEKYSDIGGKDLWGCICSAMDWMNVATRYIDYKIQYSDNIDILCMEAYTHISAIDLIWEAIIQLHRVFIDKKTIPFSGDNHVFRDDRLSKDDNEYFKHIRAVFGAHPVNLNDDTKRFAAWPTIDVYRDYDFAVTMYSIDVGKDYIVFGFRFKELEQFLDTRMEYLDVITKQIDKQFGNGGVQCN